MSLRPAALALFVCLVASVAARADDAPVGERTADVAVLRPAPDDAVLVEACARLRLELGAGGLTSVLVEGGDAFSARVALVREDDVATIDVLGTPAIGAPRHRRVRVPREEGGDDPAVLAVRAVELLRGIRLEVRRPPPATVRRAAAEGDVETADPHDADQPTWRFEAGLGVLSARPLGAAMAVGPAVTAAGAIAPHVSITAMFAGPFFTDRPSMPAGSAHTSEEMGAIGLRVDTERPTLNVHAIGAVGLHHVRAVYDASGASSSPPMLPHVISPRSVWNPAVTLAFGASLRLSPRVGVTAQLAAVLVEPALEVVSNGRTVGTLGAPSLLPTVSAWTTLW